MRIGSAGAGKMGVGHYSAVKDFRTMVAQGTRRRLDLPLLDQTLSCYEETKAKLSGGAEVSAVSVFRVNRAGK